MKKQKKKDNSQIYVLFGFHGENDIHTTGFLTVNSDGSYSITNEMPDATRFTDIKAEKYFNTEKSLYPWRFHLVRVKS